MLRGGKMKILVNRMYAGGFLNNNLGHEVINLFKTDKNKPNEEHGNRNFIYVQPYGDFDKKHDGSIDAVLLVRYTGPHMMQIIGKAEGLTQLIDFKDKTNKERTKWLEQQHKNQVKKITEDNISFGGARLNEIFEQNYHNEIAIYMTFEATEIRLANKPIYITDEKSREDKEKNIYYVGDKQFAKTSLKMYYENNKMLEDILLDSFGCWESENTTETFENIKVEQDHSNFLQLIKKEDDELSFSNMLAYYFQNNKQLFAKFEKEILNITEPDSDFEIAREENNIDLLIKGDKNVIVIENKIKSKINGLKHDIEGTIVQSQLGKYRDIVQKMISNPDDSSYGKKTYYFIFSPNYNNIDTQKIKDSKGYETIKYNDIHDFFDKNKVDDKYFNDFVNAMYKHTKPIDNDLYEDMKQNFLLKIKSKKPNG